MHEQYLYVIRSITFERGISHMNSVQPFSHNYVTHIQDDTSNNTNIYIRKRKGTIYKNNISNGKS